MRFLVLVPVFMLVACGSHRVDTPAVDYVSPVMDSAQDRHDAMVGRWYGMAPIKDGGTRHWLGELTAEGEFRIDFVSVIDGEIKRQTEVGYWGVSGDIHFTRTLALIKDGRTLPADRSKAYFSDAYRILALDATHMRYRSVDTDNEYTLRKVDAAFEIPVGDGE